MWRLRADVSLTGTEYGSVLLDEQAGRYWQLNETGAFIAGELVGGGTVAEIVTLLSDEFDVAPGRAEADVRTLVAALSGAGLLARSTT